ncbi:MAG: calcium/sodium antiporter [Thermoguttaceae bacterium]|nr:calcium/sodium antiporter [Thermoguttaceae bacterium]MDW8039644.1 calcium/sodium antiporter [Thermoguttaceae bacterium]
MEILQACFWFTLGLVVLTAGGETLVHGAVRLARALGMSPLLVGLTVVAYGTSFPEWAVTLQAAWAGAGQIALGNVVGSNIVNVLLILGASAAVAPLTVSLRLIRFDVPLLIGVSLAVWAMGWDGQIGRLEGAVLVAGIVVYTLLIVWAARQETSPEVAEEYTAAFPAPPKRTWTRVSYYAGVCVLGLALLEMGTRWMVQSAVNIALALQVSELIIGLTIVAVGTSLPEMATSLVAAIRKQRDIAVGNIVGSCLFNLLLVLGSAGLLNAEGVPVPREAQWVDLPVMVATAAVCLPIFFTGQRIARWEGFFLMGYYLAYTWYLVLRATQQEVMVRYFREAMFLFIIPLSILTLMVTTWQSFRKGNLCQQMSGSCSSGGSDREKIGLIQQDSPGAGAGYTILPDAESASPDKPRQ